MNTQLDRQLAQIQADAHAAQMAWDTMSVIIALVFLFAVYRALRWLRARDKGPHTIECPYLWTGFTRDSDGEDELGVAA
jgi:hypothetical protein